MTDAFPRSSLTVLNNLVDHVEQFPAMISDSEILPTGSSRIDYVHFAEAVRWIKKLISLSQSSCI